MNVRWSHCVLKAHNVDTLVDFYCETFGWRVADRGMVGDSQIVFLSGSSADHHQMAIMSGRPDGPGGALDHNAFRVDTLADVKDVHRRMAAHEHVKYAAPLTHGNAVSVYFVDPEGNGVEVFCDTDLHVPQPVVEGWDPSESDDAILAGLAESYAGADGVMAMDAYRAQQAEVFGEV